MPAAHKILAQTNTNGIQTIYTVPAGTQTVVSTVTICNTSGTAAAQWRVGVDPAASAGVHPNRWLTYNVTIPANGYVMLTLGITLAAGDKIVAYATTTDVSFNVFGAEIT